MKRGGHQADWRGRTMDMGTGRSHAASSMKVCRRFRQSEKEAQRMIEDLPVKWRPWTGRPARRRHFGVRRHGYAGGRRGALRGDQDAVQGGDYLRGRRRVVVARDIRTAECMRSVQVITSTRSRPHPRAPGCGRQYQAVAAIVCNGRRGDAGFHARTGPTDGSTALI